MAMRKQLWSMNALAVELGRDRRTVAAALDTIAPDGVLNGYPAWYLTSALDALEPGGKRQAQLGTGDRFAAHFVDRLENWRAIQAEEPLTWTMVEIAESFGRSVPTLLTWLRAGMPYVEAGDWETGNGFLLRPSWVFDFYLVLCRATQEDKPAAATLRVQ